MLTLLPVGDIATYQRPESLTVVRGPQVHQLMADDVLHQVYGELFQVRTQGQRATRGAGCPFVAHDPDLHPLNLYPYPL